MYSSSRNSHHNQKEVPRTLHAVPTPPLLGALLLFPAADCLSDTPVDYARTQRREIVEMQKQTRSGISDSRQNLQAHSAGSQAEFGKWRADRHRQISRYKQQIQGKWGQVRTSTPKTWIEYGSDLESVSVVDFEEGAVDVEVLIDSSQPPSHARQSLHTAVLRVLNSTGSGQGVPVATPTDSRQPVLAGQIRTDNGEPVAPGNVAGFADRIVDNAVTGSTGNQRTVLTVRFSLVPDHIRRRMTPLLPIVQKYCTRYRLDQAHVLATIHTESCFNPMAWSSKDAVGLMQLVPESGAREAYGFVHGRDIVPTPRYLLVPENNIELGCAYIHVLKSRYFGGVVDRQSRLYCSIAAYNTGPGNVAYAFMGERTVARAASVINGMDNSRQVYDCMVRRLPYEETRLYLAGVTERMGLYTVE